MDRGQVDPDDLLSFYLVEMSQEALLTFDEETMLARQIEMGRLAQCVINQTDYTTEECHRLKTQIETGQAARERLSRANTRLVVSIAKRYRGRGIPFLDLIQDGNEGLMRAVDRYDPRMGFRFSTYASWWIRQAVTRSLSNHGRMIRIPVHMGDRMREMAQVAQRLETELERQPSSEEIAAAMNVPLGRIHEMMCWTSQVLSLEQPLGEESMSDLGETIEDDDTPQPDELVDLHILSEKVRALVSNLDAREQRVLRLRYGFVDGRTHTLQEVADKFGLSRERIRQLERGAFIKLRMAAGEYRLEQFLSLSSLGAG